MITASLRDLQYRSRRFLITIVGTGLVFALTLLLAGVADSFDLEAGRVMDQLGADGWIVAVDSEGPFVSATPFAESETRELTDILGLDAASPMVFTRTTISARDDIIDLNLIGAEPGGVGMPVPDHGRAPEESGEVLASEELGYEIGDEVFIGTIRFEVVGTLDDSTALAGVPNAFLPLEDAQVVAFAGQPVVTSVAYLGSPVEVPPEFRTVGPNAGLSDLLRPIEDAQSGIDLMSLLLWIVAGSIVGSVIYLSTLEREQDFAVFKATGWSTASLGVGLVIQTLVVTLSSALVGGIVAALLAPHFPLATEITPRTYLTLPVVAVLIGLVASTVGLRRITAIDPVEAFE